MVKRMEWDKLWSTLWHYPSITNDCEKKFQRVLLRTSEESLRPPNPAKSGTDRRNRNNCKYKMTDLDGFLDGVLGWILGNGRNTVSRVLFRRRELTEPHWVLRQTRWVLRETRWVRFGTQILGWKELTEFAPRISVSPEKLTEFGVWNRTPRNRLRPVSQIFYRAEFLDGVFGPIFWRIFWTDFLLDGFLGQIFYWTDFGDGFLGRIFATDFWDRLLGRILATCQSRRRTWDDVAVGIPLYFFCFVFLRHFQNPHLNFASVWWHVADQWVHPSSLILALTMPPNLLHTPQP